MTSVESCERITWHGFIFAPMGFGIIICGNFCNSSPTLLGFYTTDTIYAKNILFGNYIQRVDLAMERMNWISTTSPVILPHESFDIHHVRGVGSIHN